VILIILKLLKCVFKEFEKQTRLVIEFLRHEVEVVDINGEQQIGAIVQEIINKLTPFIESLNAQ